MILRDCNVRRAFLLATVFVIFLILALAYSAPPTYYTYLPHPLSQWASDYRNKGETSTTESAETMEPAVNSTLGFQKILAVTKGTPWRVEGLKEAAKLTGVEIDTTPLNVSDAELDEFIGGHGIGRGAVAAWYGHIKTLRRVRDEGLGSALIMEDDVDFDVRIKEQMSTAYKHMIQLIDAAKPQPDPDLPPRAGDGGIFDPPYRDKYDLLWVGTCGDNVQPVIPNMNDFIQNELIWMYGDETVVSKDGYTGWAHNSVYNIPPKTRSVLWSRESVCSFAYAVTSTSVDKVLRFVSDLNVGFAYDVTLHHLCGDGRLRCISVIPELFHEYLPPQSEDITTSELAAADGHHAAKPGDVLKLGMGFTVNIQQSARCRALYDKTCFPGRQDPT